MDDPRRSSTHENGESREILLNDDHLNFLGFPANITTHALLLGADKLLMTRKPDPLPTHSNFEPQTYHELHENLSNGKIQGKYTTKENRKVKRFEECKNNSFHATSRFSNEYKSYNGYNNDEFSFSFIAFATVLMLKLASFQISLLLRFFTFPIWLLNLSFMFVEFPFQILTHFLREHLKKKLMIACHAFYIKLKSQTYFLRLAVRFGKAVFCGAYVFFVLVGMLVSGFVISGVIMRNLVQERIHTTETLNFDYTKTSPAAIVPVVSGVLPSKLKLAVLLTLPESEYNRKLGVFQVRVETLSSNGKVVNWMSYPTMLRFKSQSIRAVETLFKSVHLITGMKSEVQNLKIVMGEFNEGHGAMSSFKVILEQRAEFQGGSGVPQIYGGYLEIESELSKLKRVLWNWRRTAFVWVGFGSFLSEVMVFLIFFRPVVLPGGRTKAMGSSKYTIKQNQKVKRFEECKNNSFHATSRFSNEYESYNNGYNNESFHLLSNNPTLKVLYFFPIWFFNLSFMFVMFPFQILTHLREHLKKKLMIACHASYIRLKSQTYFLRLAVRFGKAVFCGAYVFFVLVGMLVSDIMVQERIHTAETLNFDYTKTSPTAIVPVVSGFLPSNLKLTVLLTLPESECNRKLGVFQVRVETLSSNGKVVNWMSYPTMLRFKSQSIRAVETLFKSVHLITGMKSEVQNLKIAIGEFNEGHGAMSSFKVILEQRAEFQGGSGVPQIYGGYLEIEYELLKLKRVLWNWRRTAFVWVGFGLFFGEVMVFLIFFRPVVLPGGRTKAMGSSKKRFV
ncbi:seipin [Striga asiatica]|uniref:Seipin n=1 Tax=Striga asiatica TaxID=4170 RepID=A0A5A7P8J4_STRAF|nr:seipin [Striga asiatica]